MSLDQLETWVMANEAALRGGSFVLLLLVLLAAQALHPRRDVPGGWRRRGTNLALVVTGTLLLRLAFPVLAVGTALWAEARGFGLLHQLALPVPLAFAAGVLMLDVAIYWQHRLMHAVPLLWRLHRVHHADLGFDVTTGIRFHPLEIALSMAVKMGLVALLGVGVGAVIVFELLLSLGSLFTHANLALPARLDRALRWLFVTPDMHRVHHSVHRDETDSNFGFHLSVWDRLFGSYREQPRDGHERMAIGLGQYREPRDQGIVALLLNPFRTPAPARAAARAPIDD